LELFYKLCSVAEWAEAEAAGLWVGSAVDVTDGFIHFSTAHQLAGTAAKHFFGRSDLLLVSIDPAGFGDALKWELSRGGDMFPHLYAPLPVAAAVAVRPVLLDAGGVHILPEAVS
jgi:uncharacterized protein (DUF952 family)